MDLYEGKLKLILKKLGWSFLWGAGAMIIGGFIDGWMGAAVALAILSYWRVSTIALSNPLLLAFIKSAEDLEKRQTINKALLEDLEKIREEFDELKQEMYSFQNDMRENFMDFREQLRSK